MPDGMNEEAREKMLIGGYKDKDERRKKVSRRSQVNLNKNISEYTRRIEIF